MAVRKKGLQRSDLIKLGIPLIFFPGLILASLLGWDYHEGLRKIEEAGGYKRSEIIFPTRAQVQKVDDGDTIQLDNGQQVRLIGINAPDRGETGFEESRNYLQGLIEGEVVYIEYDTYQDDKFGRLLAYVFEKCSNNLGCKDGKRMVNFVMLKKDLAELVIYKERRKLKYQDYLESAQK